MVSLSICLTKLKSATSAGFALSFTLLCSAMRFNSICTSCSVSHGIIALLVNDLSFIVLADDRHAPGVRADLNFARSPVWNVGITSQRALNKTATGESIPIALRSEKVCKTGATNPAATDCIVPKGGSNTLINGAALSSFATSAIA